MAVASSCRSLSRNTSKFETKLKLLLIVFFGISCALPPSCGHFEVRLSGGDRPNQGLLELRTYGSTGDEWESVCAQAWSDQNSQVVCRQLGYPGFVRNSAAGDGDRAVGNRGLISCTGSENDLLSCPIARTTVTFCFVREAISIACQDFGYIGCFQQRTPGYVANAVFFRLNFTNNDDCIAACKPYYNFAGSSGLQCFCTFEAPVVELDVASETECSEPCPANPLQACGRRNDGNSLPFFTFFDARQGFCENLDPPRNGSINGTSYRYGHTVTFSCDQGFVLVGAASLRCLESASNASEIAWNGVSPICAPMGVEAGSTTPGTTTNGISTSTGRPNNLVLSWKNNLVILISVVAASVIVIVIIAVCVFKCVLYKKKIQTTHQSHTCNYNRADSNDADQVTLNLNPSCIHNYYSVRQQPNNVRPLGQNLLERDYASVMGSYGSTDPELVPPSDDKDSEDSPPTGKNGQMIARDASTHDHEYTYVENPNVPPLSNEPDDEPDDEPTSPLTHYYVTTPPSLAAGDITPAQVTNHYQNEGVLKTRGRIAHVTSSVM